MEATHVDPGEAVQAFLDLHARTMVPVHYDTLVNGFDEPGEARATLARVMKERGLGEDRVRILPDRRAGGDRGRYGVASFTSPRTSSTPLTMCTSAKPTERADCISM